MTQDAAVSAGADEKVAGAAAGGGAGQAVSGSAVQDTGAGAGTVQTRDTSISSEKKQLADTNTEELMSMLSGIAARMGEIESQLNVLNGKRTYDLHQSEDLKTTGQARSLDLQVQAQDLSAKQKLDNLHFQAVQNSIETANMVAKQAVRHGDIAIDNEWNPVQQGAGDTLTARSVSLDDASLKAIGAAIANVISQVQPKTA